MPPQPSRRFPANPAQIGEARLFLKSLLDGSPLAYDALLCLSELATNSVTHSNSRERDGQFTVRAQLHDDGLVRVEVEDQGGPWVPRAKADGQPRRGLLLVNRLAQNWGIQGDGSRFQTVWFELSPVPPGQRPTSNS